MNKTNEISTTPESLHLIFLSQIGGFSLDLLCHTNFCACALHVSQQNLFCCSCVFIRGFSSDYVLCIIYIVTITGKALFWAESKTSLQEPNTNKILIPKMIRKRYISAQYIL